MIFWENHGWHSRNGYSIFIEKCFPSLWKELKMYAKSQDLLTKTQNGIVKVFQNNHEGNSERHCVNFHKSGRRHQRSSNQKVKRPKRTDKRRTPMKNKTENEEAMLKSTLKRLRELPQEKIMTLLKNICLDSKVFNGGSMGTAAVNDDWSSNACS